MVDFFAALGALDKIVPRIKGPIQLAALIFSVFSAALIYKINPNNIAAIGIVGAIGVALIAIPLAFHANVLKYIPIGQRVWFMLTLVVIFLCSFGALAYVTTKAVRGIPPQGARFDSRLNNDRIQFFHNHNQAPKVQLTWNLFPLSDKPEDSATVFIGIVTLHDEDAIIEPGSGKITPEACKDVPSCVGSYVFRELYQTPLFVKAGSLGTSFTAVVNIKRIPRNLRVWWEFYQLEGLGENSCRADPNRLAPTDGIPPLAMFDSQGKRIADICYRSFGQETFAVSKELTERREHESDQERH